MLLKLDLLRENMKVVILCGGFGTRIRDVADNVPKPMLTIGGMPILLHIMRYYAHWGQRQFVLCLGYQGQAIKNYFLNYEPFSNDFTLELGHHNKIEFHTEHREVGWKVTLAETGLNTMTGARVRKIAKYIGDDENFMLTYGDGVGDVDIKALLGFHISHGKVLTVTGVRPPSRFGELEIGGNGEVTAFNEKPQTSGGLISGGYFVCRREIFDYLGTGDGVVFEQEPMRNLVKDGQMMVFRHDGFWQPMDTYGEYKLLNDLYESGLAPWKR